MTIGSIYLSFSSRRAAVGLNAFSVANDHFSRINSHKALRFLINFLQSVAETLLFYHPAAVDIPKIREEREYVCDDLTAALCKDSVGYARALTKVARFQSKAEQIGSRGDRRRRNKDRIHRLVLIHKIGFE
jgi:beta-lactamase regulating signal transducer with metallopeptidase domain